MIASSMLVTRLPCLLTFTRMGSLPGKVSSAQWRPGMRWRFPGVCFIEWKGRSKYRFILAWKT